MDFGSELTKNLPPPTHPRTGTSPRGLWDFSSGLPRIPLFPGGLRAFGSGFTKDQPSPPPALELLLEDSKGDWCEETNRCIPSEYCLVAISVVHRFLSVWDTDVYYTHAYIPKVYVNIVHIRGLGLPSKLYHLIAMHQNVTK